MEVAWIVIAFTMAVWGATAVWVAACLISDWWRKRRAK